jgi:3',5'-cyclic AMP phosphodiesterase CpdA
MIHHPPLRGLAKQRKALTDTSELTDVFKSCGVELVIHGHNHATLVNHLETSSGLAHVVGVPSASMADAHGHESAQWHAYTISRNRGKWQTAMTVRRLHGGSGHFTESRSGILGEDHKF